jgi:SAM-dependent methyltransferase
VFTRPGLATIFSDIYHTNAWQDPESVSGRGSTLARTKVIMSQLPTLLQELGAETLLDAACGDFNWMRHTELGGINYVGVDVVPDLIIRNRQLYEGPSRRFVVLDITRDKLPDADVILCRDCLIHLSFTRIKRHFPISSGATPDICCALPTLQ